MDACTRSASIFSESPAQDFENPQYAGFEQRWSPQWQMRYRAILQQADLIKTIGPSYSMAAFQQRNEWMVDHSSRLIAIYNGSSGGTRNTIEYAKRKSSKSLSMTRMPELPVQLLKNSEIPCKSLFFSGDVFKNTVTKP